MAVPSTYYALAGDNTSPVGGAVQIVDPQGAARITARHLDYLPTSGGQAGGFFRSNLITGQTTGLSANNPIASIRWTNTSAYFLLLGIRACANIQTAFGTAQLVDLEAIKATAFTAADSGGTATIPSGVNQRMRTSGGSMNASLVNDMRVATTGTLTAGTRTLDSVGFAVAQFGNSNTLGNAAESDMGYTLRPGIDHPLVLGANEGIIFRVPTAQGATGKVVYYISVSWAEVLYY